MWGSKKLKFIFVFLPFFPPKKFHYLFWGGGSTNERPGTDHLISGPMGGLKKLHPMAQTNRQTHTQTDGHGNSMTEPAPWKSCQILADQLVFHCWIYHHSLMITCWSVISHQIQPLIWNRRGGYILPETAGATQSTGGSTGSLWRSGQCNHSPGRTGLILAHKKREFSTFYAWNGC